VAARPAATNRDEIHHSRYPTAIPKDPEFRQSCCSSSRAKACAHTSEIYKNTPLFSVILRHKYRSSPFDSLLVAVILVQRPLLRDKKSSQKIALRRRHCPGTKDHAAQAHAARAHAPDNPGAVAAALPTPRTSALLGTTVPVSSPDTFALLLPALAV